jgi:hypothetical protein
LPGPAASACCATPAISTAALAKTKILNFKAAPSH